MKLPKMHIGIVLLWVIAASALALAAAGIAAGKSDGKKVAVTIEVDRYKPDGRKWDATGAPDISGQIKFADGSIISIPKHQDSYSATAAGNDIKLEVGDQIHVFLEDRDALNHDLIASGFVEYQGKERFTDRVGSATLTFKVN